jgi:hypothetical protein
MNRNSPKPNWKKIGFAILSIFSLLGISATALLANQSIFLPLTLNQYPSPTPTNTATLTPTPGPTATVTPAPTITPTTSGTPQPAGTIWLIVTPENTSKDSALCYFAKTYNAAGRPVMQIYPSDSSSASERIKIPAGELVLAYDKVVLADGGGKFWKLVDYHGRDGEDLYLRSVDVTKSG